MLKKIISTRPMLQLSLVKKRRKKLVLRIYDSKISPFFPSKEQKKSKILFSLKTLTTLKKVTTTKNYQTIQKASKIF